MKSITIPMMSMILLTSYSLPAQTKIGFTAGASFANVTVKSEGISASPKLRAGITAGLLADCPLSTNFSFQPALNFVQKGYMVKDETGSEKVNFNYLEVPLNFVYSTNRNGGFFIGAGPSIAYGVSGKDKLNVNGMPDENNKIKFGSGEDKVKAFDPGANVLAGYKFAGGFMVSGNYTLGLSNIANGSNNNPDGTGTIKNRYFSVKIGYMFGGNKHK
jgi:hypothetical protein